MPQTSQVLFKLGDVYLNNALSGVVEAAAYLILAFTIDRFSRKKLLAGCLLVGGTFCLVSTVFNHFAAGNIGNSTFCLAYYRKVYE